MIKRNDKNAILNKMGYERDKEGEEKYDNISREYI